MRASRVPSALAAVTYSLSRSAITAARTIRTLPIAIHTDITAMRAARDVPVTLSTVIIATMAGKVRDASTRRWTIASFAPPRYAVVTPSTVASTEAATVTDTP